MGNASCFYDRLVHLKTRTNIRSRIVEIRMTTENLLSYFEDEEERAGILKILQQQKGQIKSYQLTLLIQKCVFEILYCSYKGAMKQTLKQRQWN